MRPNPAARLLAALDAAGTTGMDRRDVMLLLDCTSTEAQDLVRRATAAGKAYRQPGARRIYSTAPYA